MRIYLLTVYLTIWQALMIDVIFKGCHFLLNFCIKKKVN